MDRGAGGREIFRDIFDAGWQRLLQCRYRYQVLIVRAFHDVQIIKAVVGRNDIEMMETCGRQEAAELSNNHLGARLRSLVNKMQFD